MINSHSYATPLAATPKSIPIRSSIQKTQRKTPSRNNKRTKKKVVSSSEEESDYSDDDY